MRILITGAAGFIGAFLGRAWAATAHEVHGLHHPESDGWRIDGSGIIRHAVDLTDSDATTAAVKQIRPDAIVHAAAHGAYSWQRDFVQMCAVNIAATSDLVNVALGLGVARFVHLGSSSEYGWVDSAPSETARIAPNSAYAITKAAGTHIVADAIRSRGLPGVVLRLYSVYGPWEDPGRLMPTVAWWGSRGSFPPKLTAPSIGRDFVNADDVLFAVNRCLETSLVGVEPPVLNIGNGVQTTLGELIEIARRVFGITDMPVWGTMEPRTWDTSTWISDPSRARSVLGWSAGVELAEGLRSLATFIGEHPARYGAARLAKE